MLIFVVFGIGESFVGLRLFSLGVLIVYVYVGWAIVCFYNKWKKINYFKGILVYMIGMVILFVVVILIGMLIDVMIWI